MTSYAQVAVFPHRVAITNRFPPTYTYTVPDNWPELQAGAFVLVPFGLQGKFDRLVSGVVVRITDAVPDLAQARVKPLEALLDADVVVSPVHLELAQWLADYYLEPLSNCVRLFAPPGQSIHSEVEYARVERDDALPRFSKTQAELFDLLRIRGSLRAGQINANFQRRDWQRAIDRLVDQGWVTRRRVLPSPGTHAKRSKLVELSTHPIDLNALSLGRSREAAPRRRLLIEFLQQHPEPIETDWLLAETGGTPADLDFLHSHGLIEFLYHEVLRDPLAARLLAPVEPPVLTNDQVLVWDEIHSVLASARSPQPAALLLHGITGSGKTEIYLRAAAEVLRQGRQTIILVPEISLTPQTIRRFAARFSERLAVWHSELSLNERYDTWRRVKAGEVDIVIGARSALYLPFDHPGLIVLDEEHDNSFKQNETSASEIPVHQPLYHARDVAVELGRLTNAVVILGSATPSLEAWLRAQRGAYRLLTLSRRILGHAQPIQDREDHLDVQAKTHQPADGNSDAARYTELPPVEVVDLRAELKAGNTHLFSRRLQRALAVVLQRGEQAILFMNRRGHATFVMCRDCGYVVLCPRCDSPLTYHEPIGNEPPERKTLTLICHMCNYREVQPGQCPACGSTRIRYFGSGTQKIESELTALFPAVRTLRWDRDTTTGKGAHEVILQRFSEHQADVLIGTQMIAKGLDLPLVTLVGVVSADTSLHLPDFRASERTFQLLTQVAGRAGRSRLGGRAIIQTYTPDHYAIEAAAQHNYAAFVEKELEFRHATAYPPYTRLVRLILRDTNPARARVQAEQVAEELEGMLTKRGVPRGTIIGPAPCFFPKVRDEYRWHIALRHPDPASLVRELKLGPNWRIDIDPLNML